MNTPEFDTVQLQERLARLRAGDVSARNEVLQMVYGRMEKCTVALFREFPSLSGTMEPADVLQNAVVRLMRSLRKIQPDTCAGLFALMTQQIRRELLAQVERQQRPTAQNTGPGRWRNEATSQDRLALLPEQTEPEVEENVWCLFHEQVAELPLMEREVLSLVYYHRWTQAQVAEVFQVDERTVHRYWKAALEKMRPAEAQSV